MWDMAVSPPRHLPSPHPLAKSAPLPSPAPPPVTPAPAALGESVHPLPARPAAPCSHPPAEPPSASPVQSGSPLPAIPPRIHAASSSAAVGPECSRGRQQPPLIQQRQHVQPELPAIVQMRFHHRRGFAQQDHPSHRRYRFHIRQPHRNHYRP